MGLFTKVSINDITDRLFYKENGQMFVSAIFGLALALLFQKVCKDRKCLMITAPDTQEITSKIHEFEGECYRYTTQAVHCPEDASKVIKSV
jgi:hypothetical protein